MQKKVLVVYYSQTGQLREIIDSLTTPFAGENIEVVYEELRPKSPYPFPWTSDEFFQAMPECVRAIPCELEPLTLNGQEVFDLIVIAWQPWFLSPSIPFHAFFHHETTRKLLSGKPVVTITGCRNMWIMAMERIKINLQTLHATHAGNIVLFDRAPNLVSLISIIRWLFTGQKGRYLGIIPPAGVSETDVRGASRFGSIIADALNRGDLGKLQRMLVEAGAVDVLPELLMIEKRGIILFRLWASFILKKGTFGDPARLARVRLFKYYLLTMLYLVSPFATLLFYITMPFRRKAIKKQISLYQMR